MAELDTKGRLTRDEVADFLRDFADELDGRGTSERPGRDREQSGRDRRIAGGRDGDDRRTDARTRDDPGHRDGPDLADPRAGGQVSDADERPDQDGVFDRTDGTPDVRRVTLVIGGESATVTVPEMVEFDIKVASKSPMLSSKVTQAVDFDLSWQLEDTEDEERSIDVV